VLAYGVPTILAWVAVLIPLALSWIQKWRARKLKLLALEMKPGTSEKELDAEAKKSINKNIGTGAMLFLVAVALSIATISLSACASFTLPASGAGIANVRQAEKAVVILGDTYEASMEILVALRGAGKISDSQWAEIDDAQLQVNIYGPQLVSAVEMWRRFGSREGFNANYDEMKRAVNRVAKAKAEVAR